MPPENIGAWNLLHTPKWEKTGPWVAPTSKGTISLPTQAS